MTRVICAVFDIDDTLYLERDYVRSGFEAVGCWAARWLHIRDFAERCASRFRAGDRGAIFDAVLEDCGRRAEPGLISALIEIYRTHRPSISLAADASEALAEIRRSTAIAVITDGPAASQSRKAEALGLSSFAAPILLTEVLGSEFRKPHPRAFEDVKKCRPASVYVYIGDNPLKDFGAPQRLGWVTVRVRRPGGLHSMVDNVDIIPDHEIDNCSGLAELLGQL